MLFIFFIFLDLKLKVHSSITIDDALNTDGNLHCRGNPRGIYILLFTIPNVVVSGTFWGDCKKTKMKKVLE